MRVAGPKHPDFEPAGEVLDECRALCQQSGGRLLVGNDPHKVSTRVSSIA